MRKIFLALISFVFMLCLPAWLDGKAYPVLYQSNFKQLTTYTEPYHELMKKMDEVMRPKQAETVIVSSWQDSNGNVHFSSHGQAPIDEDVRSYEVKTDYTGRFAFPRYWVWASMFVVWLIIFISTLLCWNLLTKSSNHIKQARTIGVAERGDPSNDRNSDLHIEYENKNSFSGHTSANSNALSAAHRILGTTASSSPEEIKTAYHSKMRQYHPDKVAHLGQELQDVARKKATEINRAYAMLVK